MELKNSNSSSSIKKNKRDGTANLIPLNRKTKEEQKIITTAGGIASGKVRRHKRLIRETMEEVMALNLDNEDEMLKEIEKRGITDKSEQMAMCLSMAKVARVKPEAFEKVYTILGQKPVDRVANINAEYSGNSKEFLAEFFGEEEE